MIKFKKKSYKLEEEAQAYNIKPLPAEPDVIARPR